MNLLEKSDDEIIAIANPIWDNLVKTSNMKDYGGFTKDFGTQMLFGANEVELGKQWANNKLLTSLKEDYEAFGCLEEVKILLYYLNKEVKRLKVSFLEDWFLVLRVMMLKFLEQPSTNKNLINFILTIYLTNN